VENDGPKTPSGEEEVDPTANVVHFPGDWFGPRDDLVPFGPRASDAASEVADEPSVGARTPVRAQDFWGEESASIHDAMAGPEAEPGTGAGAVEPVAQPIAASGAGVRRVRVRRPRVRLRRPRVDVRRARLRLPRPAVPRLGRRPTMVAAGVAFGCLLVASVVGSLWSGAVSAPRAGRDAAGFSPAVIGPAVPPITTAPTKSRPASRRSAGHGRASHAAHSRARVSRARVSASSSRTRGGSEAVAAAASPSGSVANSASSVHSSTGTAGSSATSSGGGAPPASASSDSTSGSGGGSGGSGQTAGPAGPGAPFGPGHLG
jgi:hypothetical protein